MLSGGGRARRPPQRYDELDVPTACEAKAAQARNKARTRPAVPTRKSPRVEAAAAAAGQQAFDYDGLLTGIYGETSTRAEAIEDEQESDEDDDQELDEELDDRRQRRRELSTNVLPILMPASAKCAARARLLAAGVP